MTSQYVLTAHFTFKLDGKAFSTEMSAAVQGFHLEQSLHLADMLTLQLVSLDAQWLSKQKLEPGASLEVISEVLGQSIPLFQGEIVELEPEFQTDSVVLKLRAFDRMHRLAHGVKTRSWVDVKDSDLVSTLGKEAGLKVDAEDTRQVFPHVLQLGESDLRFLKRRAAQSGRLLFVRGDTLFLKGQTPEDPEIELDWKKGDLLFRPRLSLIDQATHVTVRGWNEQEAQDVEAKEDLSDRRPQIGESKSGAEILKSVFSRTSDHTSVRHSARSQSEAEQLAKAISSHHHSSFVEAEGSTAGSAHIHPGVKLRLKNTWSRFDGTYVVSEAVHTYSQTIGYRTEFKVKGQQSGSLLDLLTARRPEASSELRMAVVCDNHDPEGRGRVKVRFPSFGTDIVSDWTRVLAAGAGAARGLQLTPEVGDEVLIGFQGADPDQPIVLGGLWNGKNKPPEKSDEITGDGKTQKWLMQSRKGHRLQLEDTDGSSGILLRDSAGNLLQVETDSGQMTLKTSGNISLESTTGNVAIQCKGSASIEATSTVTVSGLAIELDGKTQVCLKVGPNQIMVGPDGVTVLSMAQVSVTGVAIAVTGSGTVGLRSSGPLTLSGAPISFG